ncbi:MAG: rhodanese-like domain-containing protein [Desulfobacteraceae bacterium]|nr:rhodanese-like domain-containing protein [Desulfobacteraceae bacterium]
MKGVQKAFLALVAVVVTVGLLWYDNRTIVPKKSTYQDVVAEARAGGYQLTSTEGLWERYSKEPQGLLAVDTRQEWEYRTGHIKGALNFPMEPTWLSRWRKKGALEKFLGPDKNRLVVFY